jgi:ADP-heptose:LPS heptosyltransferase
LNINDRNRSVAPSILTPLCAVPGVCFYSLQKGEAARKKATLCADLKLVDWTESLHDFADTAALVANLDLVISVDTAVAHLAGAMGKPVWLMGPAAPDWRWMLHRGDSPWYPTMRIFRQVKRGAWDDVVSQMSAALSLLAKAR